jgi:hypothetical protein
MLTHYEFTNAVMRGIQRANRLTVEWSAGEVTAQDQGAEYLLTVEIARELRRVQVNKHGSGFVLLEARPQRILECSSSKRGRPERALRLGGRIDVALFDQFYDPIGLVEVKRISGDGAGLAKDAARLAAIMRRIGRTAGGTIRYGALATIRIVEEKDINKVASNIIARLQGKMSDFKIRMMEPTFSRCKTNDGERWCSHALCFTLHSATT